MTPGTKPVRQDTFDVQTIACPPGWDAWLLKRPAFPLPEPARSEHAEQWTALLEALGTGGLHGQLFLQSWKLSSSTGNDIVSQNLASWSLQRGLGVWPGRAMPGGWTEESLMNAAAAAFQGEEPRLPSHYVLGLQTKGSELKRAISELAGRGVALATFAARPIPEILDERLSFYRAQVSPRFRNASFYLPLLDTANLQDLNAVELDEWMGRLDIYVRESAEDRGVLMIARVTCREILEPWNPALYRNEPLSSG